eukprot:Em0022g692a
MANVMACPELHAVFTKENAGARNLKRTSRDDLPAPISASKRPALAAITNRAISKSRQTPSKQKSKQISAQQTYLDNFLPPAIAPLPIKGDILANAWDSISTAAPTSSSNVSFRLTTKSPGSPMLFSSPDMINTSLMCTEVIDIDVLEDNCCAACGEYAKDIFSYLRESEVKFQPRPDYMSRQHDITHGMRSILVDWLVEVSDEFNLNPQTLYQAVSITDRFLSTTSVLRAKLQLVGSTSVYIASKLEEIYPPDIGEFAYITDDTYTKREIVKMEQKILGALSFNIITPTVHTFLERYLKIAEAEQHSYKNGENADVINETIFALGRYLCELALLSDDPYLKYLPSVVAAAAVCLARHTIGQVAWPAVLQYYTGYMVCDIGNCLQDLHRTFSMAQQHPQQAVRTKYSSEKYLNVSSLRAPETLPC